MVSTLPFLPFLVLYVLAAAWPAIGEGDISSILEFRPGALKAGCQDDIYYSSDGWYCQSWIGFQCWTGYQYGVAVPQLLLSCPESCDARLASCSALDAIKIATILPDTFSPQTEMISRQYKTGYDQFLQYLVTSGGFSYNGTTASMTILSAQEGDLDQVAKRLTKIIEADKIKLIIAPFLSEKLEIIAQVAASKGALIIAPVGGWDDTYANRSLMFSMTTSFNKTLQPVFHEIAKFGPATVSTVSPQEGIADVFRHPQICGGVPQASKTAGLEFVFDFRIDQSLWTTLQKMPIADAPAPDDIPESLKHFILNLTLARPDVLVCCGEYKVCRQILVGLWATDYSPSAVIFVDDGTMPRRIHGPAYSKPSLESELMRDVLIVSEWDQSETDIGLPELLPVISAENFSEQFYGISGSHANFYAASAFSALSVLLEAVRLADSPKPTDVAKQLLAMDADSLFGRVSFNADGQRNETSISTEQLQVEYASSKKNFAVKTRFDVITPQRKSITPLHFPRPTWREFNCRNHFWPSIDGRMYGLQTNSNNDLECMECPVGSIKIWDASNVSKCSKCPAGTWVSGSAGEEACMLCAAGRFSATVGLEGDCPVCLAGSYSSQRGSTSCTACAAGTYQNYPEKDTCWSCTDFSIGTPFKFFSAMGSTTCVQCPDGGVCDPDLDGSYTNFTNMDGYFRLAKAPADDSLGLYPCAHEGQGGSSACLARGRCHNDASNEQTMEGPMCGTCRPGFARSFHWDLCEKCPGLGESLLRFVAHSIVLLALPGLIMLVILSTDFLKPMTVHCVIIKQLLDYMHMATIVASTDGLSVLYGRDLLYGKWSGIFGFSESGPTVSDASVPCLASHFFPELNIFQFYTILGLCWFPSTAIISSVLFRCINCVRQATKRKQIGICHLVSWLVLNVFVFIPRVNNLLLVSWRCKEFDVSRLMWDTRFECGSEELALWNGLSILGILLFSLGCPLLLVLVLRRYKKKEQLQTLQVSQMFGFLYSGFGTRYYYFECVYLIRKIVFALVLCIPGSATELAPGIIQNCTLALLAAFFLGLNLASQPYDNRAYFLLDKIENSAIASIFIIASLQTWVLATEGSVFMEKRHSTQIRNVVCIAMIFTSHGVFFLFALWGLIRHWVLNIVLYYRPGSILAPRHLEIRSDGFDFCDLTGEDENLFISMISDIIELHADLSHKVTYSALIASIQRICLECHRHKIETAIKNSNRLGHVVKVYKARVNRFLGQGRSAAVLSRGLDWINKTFNQQADDRPESKAKINSMRQMCYEMEYFTPDNVAKTVGEKFNMEELYSAFMSLGKKVCDYDRAVVVQGLTSEDHTDKDDAFLEDMLQEPMHVGKLGGHLALKTKLRAMSQELQ
ncbi:unnamed protein product, partial [Polarella glacialis]